MTETIIVDNRIAIGVSVPLAILFLISIIVAVKFYLFKVNVKIKVKSTGANQIVKKIIKETTRIKSGENAQRKSQSDES